MLRQDVVDACEAGKFHIYAVTTIHEAIELMTGHAAGEYGEDGYPEDSLLGQAVEQAHAYWRRTLSGPAKLTSVEASVPGDDEQPLPPEEINRVESD